MAPNSAHTIDHPGTAVSSWALALNVLLLHNRYRAPGGEERSIAEIEALLRERGHRVELLERSSAGLGRARAAAGMLRGGLDPDAVADAVRRSGAEVVHAHNINPDFGPRALEAARGAGARVVMHLHNYRLVCAAAIAYRAGDICTECHGRDTAPGARHRCRGSSAESVVYAAGIARAQSRVLAAVDRFAVPSAAALARLTSFGLPDERMTVLSNFLPDDRFAQDTRTDRGEHALFVGRLAQEKGADLAIDACARAGVPLVIAGVGPAEAALRKIAARSGSEVAFAGHVGARELDDLRATAAVALFPSRWDEPGPYALIEAMAAGVPPLVSAVGGLREMAGSGNAIASRDIDRWVERIQALKDAGERQRAGEAALERARELFSAERFYGELMEIYGQ